MPDRKDKTAEEVAAMVDAVAKKQGWVKNPDDKFRVQIEQGLTTTWKRYGYHLCPCRDGEGTREEDRDIMCPCVYAKADIAEFGHCFCGLYLSKEFILAKKTPRGIPERRGSF